MSNLKQQGIKALIWDFSGKVAAQGVGFIISLFLARLLEPEEFGLVAMIMVIIGMANVFSDVGLGSALIQRRKVLPIHYSSVFYFNIFVGLLLTLATYFSAGWIAAFYQNDALIPLTQAMSLSFVVNAFSNVQTTKLQRDLNYAALSKANFLASFAGGALGIWLAFHGAGVWSLVAQSLASGIVFNVLIWSMSQWSPSLLFSVKALMQLWGFGFRMFFSALIASVYERLDFLIIGKLFVPATLGYFQRAKSLNNLAVQFSSASLMAVLFPVLSKVQNDLIRLQNITIKVLNIIVFVVFYILGNLYLTAQEIITILFSERWLESVGFFKILVLSGFAYPISALLVSIISSRGNSKAFLRLEIYKKTLASINLFSLYAYGINYYLYGLIITSSFSLILNAIFAAREIKVSARLLINPVFLQLLISIIATLCTISITPIKFENEIAKMTFTIFAFSILYLLTSFILKAKSLHYFKNEVLYLIKH